MRAAGNRAADYAAVTRIEYADTEREDAEQWEEELVLARSGDAYLRAEVERQVMYDAGGARSWKDDDDGAPVPLGRRPCRCRRWLWHRGRSRGADVRPGSVNCDACTCV